MEEDSSNSSALINISESNIRIIQSDIQAQLENFGRKIPDTTFLESSICDKVRDQILNSDDEPHLSKIQNNCRRIFIASELFTGICSLFSHAVDYKFRQIISDMIQWEKFKILSRKISHKIQLEAKREKYFAKEAQSKLLKSLEDAKSKRFDDTINNVILGPINSTEQILRPVEDTESLPRSTVEVEQIPRSRKDMEQMLSLEDSEKEIEARYEKGSPLVPIIHELIEGAGKETTVQAINEALALPCESSFKTDSISSITRDITEIRAEPLIDTSHLQYPISNILRQDLSLPSTAAEISIVEPNIQQKTADDINQILHILEDHIIQKEIVEIQKPKNLLEATDKTIEELKEVSVEELPNGNEKLADASEKSESEEWSLPSLEPLEKIRKRHPHLIIDEVTIIPEYAARALQMNRNINIQRVQVYEGPPEVLQAISVNHLMTTPGFKNSLFQDSRSSKLSRLYNRHLEVEKRPVEPRLLQKRMIDMQQEVIAKKRIEVDIMEEVGTRAGMRSAYGKTDVLIEAGPEKSRQEDLEVLAPGILPKESIVGMPMSRIITSTIEPPEEEQMERINAPILLTPRVQQLQGKSLDPKASLPSWFLFTKENPPNAKYREFNYVYEKLRDYWSLFESQGLEKCISLREFFSFEQTESNANFLLVLRIVDKMSIQKKLVLEYKNHDVLIRPFERPYVSDKQLLLKEKESIF